MDTMTTKEAARLLGVGQVAVRKLIGSGQLAQVGTVGRMILLDQGSVEDLVRVGTRPGRPWSEEITWGALALVSGQKTVSWVGGTQFSRLKKKLHTINSRDFVILARKRGQIHRFRGTPDMVGAVAEHVLPSGTAALTHEAIASRFGLTQGAESVDGYVHTGGAKALQDTFGLVENRYGNITIRETSVAQTFETGSVPLAGIALDLMECPAARERVAGMRVLEELLNDWAPYPQLDSLGAPICPGQRIA